MPTRDYKLASPERGRSDDTVLEFFTDDDGNRTGSAFMAIMPRTPSETKMDIVVHLSRAYQDGRKDRGKELLPDAEAFLADMVYLYTHGAAEGIELLVKERRRQIEEKGYDAAHDDRHDSKEMLSEAAVKLNSVGAGESDYPVTDLVRAGALLAAELDRIDRMMQRVARDGRN